MPEQNHPQITVRVDRERVDGRRSSFAHVVVDVHMPVAESDPSIPTTPLNLGLVIDASGSMAAGETSAGHDERFGRSRLEAAKQAAAAVVDQLADRDVVSVVSFSSDTLTHLAPLELDSAGRASALAAIGTLSPRGCTNLCAGWLKGAEHVARHAESRAAVRNRILLLSDGYANDGVTDPDSLASTANELRSRGISTSTVGIGLDYSTEQMEVLAEHGGGMMHHAEVAEDIVAVILAELRDMQDAALENVEVSLKRAGGVHAARISTLGLPGLERDGAIVAALGSMVGGATRRVVFRVDLAMTAAAGEIPFTVSVSCSAGGAPRTTRERSLNLGVALQIASALDGEAARLAASAWLDHVTRKSVRLNQELDYEGIGAWLNREIDSFVAYCGDVPACHALIARMRKLARRAVQPMPEVLYREISLSALKHLHCADDMRVKQPVRDIESLLDVD